jgi:hypothetical protein
MGSCFRRLRLTCGVAALILLSPGYASQRRPSLDGLPRLVLWAWERPEDLRQLGAGVGVAFLAQTVTISGGHVTVHPRLQPLRVQAANPLIAVTRIETGRFEPVGLTRDATDEIASLIARTATLPRVRGAQIDFDATLSERDFYRALIHQVRASLNPAAALSITALASWCRGDDWLEGLPIDEAVPMLFRMGPVHAPFQRLASSPSRASAACRSTVGTSLDEPLAASVRGRRVYVFNAKPWTQATLLQAYHLIQ